MEFDIHIKSLDDIKPACIELFENEMKARGLTLIDVILGVTLSIAYTNTHVFNPSNRGVKMEKPNKLTKDMTSEEAIEGIFTKEVCDDLMKTKQNEHINHSFNHPEVRIMEEEKIESKPIKEEDIEKGKKKGKIFGDPVVEF